MPLCSDARTRASASFTARRNRCRGDLEDISRSSHVRDFGETSEFTRSGRSRVHLESPRRPEPGVDERASDLFRDSLRHSASQCPQRTSQRDVSATPLSASRRSPMNFNLEILSARMPNRNSDDRDEDSSCIQATLPKLNSHKSLSFTEQNENIGATYRWVDVDVADTKSASSTVPHKAASIKVVRSPGVSSSICEKRNFDAATQTSEFLSSEVVENEKVETLVAKEDTHMLHFIEQEVSTLRRTLDQLTRKNALLSKENEMLRNQFLGDISLQQVALGNSGVFDFQRTETGLSQSASKKLIEEADASMPMDMQVEEIPALVQTSPGGESGKEEGLHTASGRTVLPGVVSEDRERIAEQSRSVPSIQMSGSDGQDFANYVQQQFDRQREQQDVLRRCCDEALRMSSEQRKYMAALQQRLNRLDAFGCSDQGTAREFQPPALVPSEIQQDMAMQQPLSFVADAMPAEANGKRTDPWVCSSPCAQSSPHKIGAMHPSFPQSPVMPSSGHRTSPEPRTRRPPLPTTVGRGVGGKVQAPGAVFRWQAPHAEVMAPPLSLGGVAAPSMHRQRSFSPSPPRARISSGLMFNAHSAFTRGNLQGSQVPMYQPAFGWRGFLPVAP